MWRLVLPKIPLRKQNNNAHESNCYGRDSQRKGSIISTLKTRLMFKEYCQDIKGQKQKLKKGSFCERLGLGFLLFVISYRSAITSCGRCWGQNGRVILAANTVFKPLKGYLCLYHHGRSIRKLSFNLLLLRRLSFLSPLFLFFCAMTKVSGILGGRELCCRTFSCVFN